MPKKKDKEMTRREVLKLGATAGAVTALAPTILTSRKASAFDHLTPPAEPTLCSAPPPVSPPTTPFVQHLPIPSPAIPKFLWPLPTQNANIGGGEAPRAPHQRWTEFQPSVTYEMDARAGLHRFHPDLEPSYIWGFEGKFPAPTVLNAYNLASLVRFRNSLPVTTTSFGRNEITIHLHNGHTPSESDGFAGDFFGTGLFKDNHYPNIYAGYDAFPPDGDEREAMHTFWFHDHRAAFTANNNYLGLLGMYLVYNKKDPGHELATPGSLRLPCYYGLTDIPLILTDKRFCATANGRTEMFQVIGAGAPGGDKWTVNGAIQPKFEVRRRKYRFRILNTGPVKQWNLQLIKPDGTNATMTVVATDANFLESPADITNLQINVAERFDFIVDFSAYPVGTKLYLRENVAQNVGVPTPDPAPGLPIGNVLMRFDVVGGIFFPDTPPIPDTLTTYPPLPAPTGFKTWEFTLDGGVFLINGLPFDANRVDHVILKGTTEEWWLRNDVRAGNWLHPVHIHFEEFRMQERTVRVSQNPDVIQNVPLTPLEQGRKDVVGLPGQNSVRLRMQFRDFVGRYLIHCHNMNHEDDFMMVRWDIVDTIAEVRKHKEEIAQRRRDAGLPPEKEVVG